jgi:hypothetical protein
MVYRSVCNLTAVTVLAHMLLGCCWHHRHASWSLSACTGYVDLVGADCHNRSCGHEHDGPGAPTDGNHRDRDGCDDSRCVFVSGQPSRSPAVCAVEFCDVVAVAATIDDGLPAGSNVWARACNATTRCPPLRTHLLEQVLLL